VARCTKIIQGGKDETGKDELKYLINAKQHGKFVVDLGEKVSPTDIEEGMRVGYVSLPHIFSFKLSLKVLAVSIARNSRSRSLFLPKSMPLSALCRSRRNLTSPTRTSVDAPLRLSR